MGRWAAIAALFGVGLAVMSDAGTARAEVGSPVARPTTCALPASPPAPMRKLQAHDLEVARREMEQAGLGAAETALRLKVIENVAKTAVVFGDLRDEKHWQYVNEAYLPVGAPSTAIRALWERGVDGKPVCENGIRCFKYSKLILLKAHLDLASPDGVRSIDKYLHGKIIPNDMPYAGDGMLYASEYREEGFPTKDLRPGDQIWIENPYYDKLPDELFAADARRKKAKDPKDPPRYAGEQGSNVFYIGGGMVMGIYSGEVIPLASYRNGMASQWWSPYDYHLRYPDARRPTAEDFLVKKSSRPLVDFVETAKAETLRASRSVIVAPPTQEELDEQAEALKKLLEAEVRTHL